MNRFLIILSIFIGILAYNIYTPTLKEIGENTRLSESPYSALGQQEEWRIWGVGVGLICGVLAYIGLEGLHHHFGKRKTNE